MVKFGGSNIHFDQIFYRLKALKSRVGTKHQPKNLRADLKTLEDMGKLAVEPTRVARGAENLIIVRLTQDAFLIIIFIKAVEVVKRQYSCCSKTWIEVFEALNL